MLLNLFLIGDNFTMLSNDHTILVSNFLRHHSTAGSNCCYLACSHYLIDERSENFIRLMLEKLGGSEMMMTYALNSDTLNSNIKKLTIAESFNDAYIDANTVKLTNNKVHPIITKTFSNYEFVSQSQTPITPTTPTTHGQYSDTTLTPYNEKYDDNDIYDHNHEHKLVRCNSSSSTLVNYNVNTLSESCTPLINLQSMQNSMIDTQSADFEMKDMTDYDHIATDINRGNPSVSNPNSTKFITALKLGIDHINSNEDHEYVHAHNSDNNSDHDDTNDYELIS